MKKYEEWFSDPDSGIEYEREFTTATYSAILWEIEKKLLRREVQDLERRIGAVDYLDFACGTGRIIEFLRPYVTNAIGIDISEPMLEVARKKLGEGVELFRQDITTEMFSPQSRYDLITCFRFLRNSDSRKRAAALRCLASRLRDRDSRLIINNHGNLHSYHLGRSIVQKLLRQEQPLSYLDHSTIREMMAHAGLEIVDVHGYSYLSSKALRLLPWSLVSAAEDFLVDKPVLRRLGGVQMYVARLRG